MIYKNGTPYSDEQWKAWYSHKSNKEAWIEAEEQAIDNQIADEMQREHFCSEAFK